MKQAKSNRIRKNGRAKTGKVNRRHHILFATEKILRSRGLSGATTRHIAETAGCSEGALYVHFNDRVELLLAVLEESLPDMLGPVHALTASIGKGTPQKNLEKALEGIFSFHQRVTPMIASLFSEPELLDRYRKSLARETKGPGRAIRNLAGYIRQEQELGRLPSNVDAQLAATLLTSASFFRAFTEQFFGTPASPPARRFFRQVIASVTSGPPK
ncbi:MAG TPA: TetR/AcrR family transcriptional regulator [Terriglobia bacterium]|nr:TetR/AcrR family transcriptional regulator [Terriglobia bacterium]